MKGNHNKAAALKHRRSVGSAPAFVATGREAVAIIITFDLVCAQCVPIHEDRNLVENFSVVDLYEEMPTYLYKAVADTLTFIHEMSARL